MPGDFFSVAHYSETVLYTTDVLSHILREKKDERRRKRTAKKEGMNSKHHNRSEIFNRDEIFKNPA